MPIRQHLATTLQDLEAKRTVIMSTKLEQLVINGGPSTFERSFPPRHLFGLEEKQAVVALFDRAIETGQAIGYNGEEEETYCAQFAQFMGGGYCDAVNSGTSAVYVALRALEIEPFTEVIVPPVTDAGGVMPVALTNCIPVVADTNTHSYNTGPEQVEARITEHTSAIIIAHIAGIPVDIDPIMEIARSRGIKVIEDCAQAHGSRYKGRLVGTIGDIAAFSTMSGKHHATAAQGGVVFTRDEQTGRRCRRMSDRGKPIGLEGVETTVQGYASNAPVTNVVASHNLNSNDLAAAVGIVQLRKLPGIIQRRRRIADTIGTAIAKCCKAIRLVTDPPQCQSVFWFLVFDVDPGKISVSKEQFSDALTAEGLPFCASYVRPQTQWTWFKQRAVFGKSGYPWSSPHYKGNPDQPMPLPHFDAMDKRLCRMDFHENLSDQDVAAIAAAFEKVDHAYAK
jgi:perosamine synthetase